MAKKAWRVAKSLLALRDQVNEAFPNRSVASDGTIGDASHSARTSDHNPATDGVVKAIDISHDPVHGLNSRKMAEAIVASRDKRVKHLISNGEICAGDKGPQPWKWRKYKGANPHTKHFHLSVRPEKQYFDDEGTWSISSASPISRTIPKRENDMYHVLSKGIRGDSVRTLQLKLNKALGLSLVPDGIFGEKTKQAVIKFQKAHQLVADGYVGPYTWEELEEIKV